MADQPAPSLAARQPRAIHSALTVLEAIAVLGAGTTAREVSVALGLPRATTYRLLNLLVQDEYLVRTPDLAGFALGSKVVQLAAAAAPPRVPAAARQVIAELRADVRGGVHVVPCASPGSRSASPWDASCSRHPDRPDRTSTRPHPTSRDGARPGSWASSPPGTDASPCRSGMPRAPSRGRSGSPVRATASPTPPRWWSSSVRRPSDSDLC
jgi:hypothetical protein